MKVMAVVNVTPDSFFDGGHHASTQAAIEHAQTCIDEGADILDIGGESTRPGSQPVSLDEERRRVLPVVEGIRRRNTTIPISIDTTKAALIREAAAYGIHYANDISALRADPEMAATVATLQLHLILMHMQGTPQTMQQQPHYNDVVHEVREFLRERAVFAETQGVPKNRIILDPGIGFGKTIDHNVALLRGLSQLATLGYPLLVGTFRKSFIGALTQTTSPKDRLPGSLATLPVLQQAGVSIVRTHDVAATKQFLTVLNVVS
jgi:dihydropteroate synthase